VIGSLRGVLLDRFPSGELLVEVGGVGYRVTAPAGTHGVISGVGAPVFLHIHTHVREDAIVLYGFATADERSCFEALLGAHGVGPALAVSILSSLSPVSLRRAVASDDVDALTVVPGVGKKTAARLLLELKSRLDVPDTDPDLVLAAVNGNGHTARAEVKAALAGLGYGAVEVRDAVRELPDDGEVEDLLRSALRQLATAR
jgi:Holliday junction DNA helicase RuvA